MPNVHRVTISAAASVRLWPASEISARLLARQPTKNSAATKRPVATVASLSRVPVGVPCRCIMFLRRRRDRALLVLAVGEAQRVQLRDMRVVQGVVDVASRLPGADYAHVTHRAQLVGYGRLAHAERLHDGLDAQF